MPITEIILIALGLSMDAFAVSVASGLAQPRSCLVHALRLGLVFGIFQALMPALGWLGGTGFRDLLAPVDHWIAFGLLMLIGLHMILAPEKESRSSSPVIRPARLLLLGVATSIDALAAGLTFALLDVEILIPITIIGAVTFITSFAGVYLGRRVGDLFARRAEILGGLILIAIGVRILAQHLDSGT